MLSVPIDHIISSDELSEDPKKLLEKVQGSDFYVITHNNKPRYALVDINYLSKNTSKPRNNTIPYTYKEVSFWNNSYRSRSI